MAKAATKNTSQLPRGAPVEEEIIQRAKRSYARLPILEVIFDRFALALGPRLKSYVGAVCEVTVDNIEYLPTGEALDVIPNPALMSVVETVSWEGPYAVVLDPSLLISVLEITFGGRAADRSAWSPRSFTAIERKIGREMTNIVLEELSEVFSKLTETQFAITHVETNPLALVLAPPNTGCVRMRAHITLDERDGYLYFIMPFNALAAVRNMLAQPFQGGDLGGDKSWRKSMTEAISDTEVVVSARLHQAHVPMQKVLNWKKGEMLDLGISLDQQVTLTCAGHDMYTAHSGRKRNGRVALKVETQLKDEEEISNVLSD
ncbi:flagellar motor switch protein FliM [Pseudooceanicola sp. C21-150M6]|uniref:flagellar motor switch protein FliM n=1 Tax=Pseudooceanicola sp. C21-150M6 TaxID=3434355 RepID=UPI003D7F9B52